MLSWYLLITLFGIVIYFYSSYSKSSLWDIWSAVDSSFAVAVGVLAFFVYIELAKEQDVIELKIKIGNKEPIDTGLSLLRKNFTRSEIMGILGMIKKNQDERYKLKFFQDKEVLKKIQNIQTGRDKVFIIEMSQEEAKQFKI